MGPPDYREAACCYHCWHLTRMGSRCIKHGGKVGEFYVCADFFAEREADKEGLR